MTLCTIEVRLREGWLDGGLAVDGVGGVDAFLFRWGEVGGDDGPELGGRGPEALGPKGFGHQGLSDLERGRGEPVCVGYAHC